MLVDALVARKSMGENPLNYIKGLNVFLVVWVPGSKNSKIYSGASFGLPSGDVDVWENAPFCYLVAHLTNRQWVSSPQLFQWTTCPHKNPMKITRLVGPTYRGMSHFVQRKHHFDIF